MSKLKEHFSQDASVFGTLLAFGMSTLAVVGALTLKVDWNSDGAFVPAIVFGLVLFLPGPVVFAARFVRSRQGKRPGVGVRCEMCGASPATNVRYLQVIGIVVVAIFREANVSACRDCSAQTCNEMSLKTAAFGWWMVLAPLVVPWVLLNNLLFFLRARSRLSSSSIGAWAFQEHADYARNLLRTKDRATVVEVLRARLHASDEAIESWLRTLE